MINDSEDPFERAAAAAALDIEPTDTLPETSTAEGLTDDAEVQSVPVRRGRGRPRSSGGRSRSRRRRTPRAAKSTGTTETQSTSEAAAQAPQIQTPVVPALPPDKLVPLLRQIDKTFVRLLGTAPLDEQELKDGAEACAPVLDHYAPLFLSQPWAPAAIWAGMVYVPRVVEVYDRRKAGGGRVPATFRPVTNGNAAESAAPQTVVG